MNAAARWYVVQTQPHAESKAARHLCRQGFQIYLPRYLKRRRHARRTETVPAPLFPRYMFVAVDIAVQRWRSIQSTIGVSRLAPDRKPFPKDRLDCHRDLQDVRSSRRCRQRSRR